MIAKAWKAQGIQAAWEKTSWAKTIATRAKRAQLTDFERFQVMVAKRQRSFAVRKEAAKLKKNKK